MDTASHVGRQMPPSKAFSSSDATRQKSGILTPSSTASLNHEPGGAGMASRKRKRDSNPMGDLLKPTIVVKAHPPKLLSKPAELQPLMILAREYLPLSYLDFTSPSGELPLSRFYESHVRILDLENRRGGGPYLLIARFDKTGTLFAIEACERGLYTVCKLGSWVEVGLLRSNATIACDQLLDLPKGEPGDGNSSRPLTTPGLHQASKERRLAIEALQSVVRRKRTQSVSALPPMGEGGLTPPSVLTDSDPSSAPAQEPAPTQESHDTPQPPPPEASLPCLPPPPPSGEELLEKIRSQYFDALYRSKGSLAYFPKGPLSRARAAFHLESDVNLSIADLVGFLKGLVIPLRQMNKKYQETIPNIVREMKTLIDSSGEEKRKKRKPRKLKLGRNGLHPREDDDVRAWWAANRPELKDGESGVSESQVKSYLSLLRSRETQLQIILCLEILALEPLAATAEAADSQLPGIQPSIEAEPPQKKAKEQNLSDLVDMNADLLCIWQSTASDEVRLLEGTQVTDHAAEGQKAQRTSSEPLKDFCVDIIIPFFSPRLPELCDSLNRKLGGPPILVSPKTKPKTKTPSKQTRPGAVTKRPSQTKKPRSLQRAFSTDQAQRDRRSMSRGPSKAVAALLSATEVAIPGLKKEGSDSQSLASIPRMKSDCGLLKSTRTSSFSRSSSNAGDVSKESKKALVDAELQNAIAALRKPNRQLAGTAMAEAAEKRVSGGLSQIRKTKKPVRMSPSDRVQVKATPMHSRFRDASAEKSQPAIAFSLSRDVVPPSSNPSVVPSTAPRKSFRDALHSTSPALDIVGATPARPAAPDAIGGTPIQGAAISATPVRQSTRSGPLEETIPGSSPLMAKKAAPMVYTGGVRNLRDLFRTPVKAAPVEQSKEAPETKKMSVYERLGWDDEYDDL